MRPIGDFTEVLCTARPASSVAGSSFEYFDQSALPYVANENVCMPDELPLVHVLIKEAPSVLNPARMKFGSVFRGMSRQWRNFGIGLGVASQQVAEIDVEVLTQLNTQLLLTLGNANERREAVRATSSDIAGFAQELQVLDRGQFLLSSSHCDIALPMQVPSYDLRGADAPMPAVDARPLGHTETEALRNAW